MMADAGMSLRVFLEEVALISDADRVEEKDNSVTFADDSRRRVEFTHVCGRTEEGISPALAVY
jgi:hypothetical protein